MALGLQPSNVSTTLSQLASISDEIWKHSGDQSTDINWYTKRALLTNIYVLTETFMLQDKSPNFDETWQFLDNRLENTRQFNEFMKSSKTFNSSVTTGVSSIMSIFKPSNLSMDDSEMLRK